VPIVSYGKCHHAYHVEWSTSDLRRYSHQWKLQLFEISGPNSIGLRRNAAGWPIRVELGYEEGQLVLLFSGQMGPERKSSSNTWGE
jgi:hypothetical protein